MINYILIPATKINKIFIPLRLININVHISLVLVQAPGHCYFSIKICSKIDCLCLTKLHFVMSKMIDFKIWNWIGYVKSQTITFVKILNTTILIWHSVLYRMTFYSRFILDKVSMYCNVSVRLHWKEMVL
jgi:hypothetical protein